MLSLAKQWFSYSVGQTFLSFSLWIYLLISINSLFQSSELLLYMNLCYLIFLFLQYSTFVCQVKSKFIEISSCERCNVKDWRYFILLRNVLRKAGYQLVCWFDVFKVSWNVMYWNEWWLYLQYTISQEGYTFKKLILRFVRNNRL